MKKLSALILALLLACGMFAAGASAETSGMFEYMVLPGGTAAITSADPQIKDGNIPAELDGRKVTAIEGGAFSGCSRLTDVTIPDTVTSIGFIAFQGCKNLKSVNIPDSVVSIGDIVFDNCPKLASITVSRNNPAYVFNNGMLISKKEPALLRYADPKARSFEVMWGIKEIADGAFSDSGLTSVSIPASVTSIGSHAFSYTSRLKEISLPDSLTSIGSQAFFMSGITSLKIPANLTSIGDSAFNWCDKLKTIEVDPSNPVFEMRGNLLVDKTDNTLLLHLDTDKGTYTVPEGIEKIASSAFFHNINLKEVIIPDSVKDLDNSVFFQCKNLVSVRLPAGLKTLRRTMFSMCVNLKNVTIPDGVTTIEYSAFYNCGKLAEVVIPASVTTIEENVFEGCKKVTVKAPAGSVAQKYCEENGIKFAELENDANG